MKLRQTAKSFTPSAELAQSQRLLVAFGCQNISKALTTGSYTSFPKLDSLQFLPLLQAFIPCFSKFSLSANLAASKKTSCILKVSSSVVAIDGGAYSATGSTCIKCCLPWIRLQYQFSAFQACFLVWICQSDTLQSPKPHWEPASAWALQMRSEGHSLPFLRASKYVQTSTQEWSMLSLSAILPCQWHRMPDLVNTVWMHSVTNHHNLKSHRLHQLGSALDPWSLPHS